DPQKKSSKICWSRWIVAHLPLGKLSAVSSARFSLSIITSVSPGCIHANSSGHSRLSDSSRSARKLSRLSEATWIASPLSCSSARLATCQVHQRAVDALNLLFEFPPLAHQVRLDLAAHLCPVLLKQLRG